LLPPLVATEADLAESVAFLTKVLRDWKVA
jgi:hypothetical protein